MRLFVVALAVVVAGCASAPASTPSSVASPPAQVLASPSVVATSCAITPLMGVRPFSGCAYAVIRATTTADNQAGVPTYEISTDGKTFTPYVANAPGVPIGLAARFGEEPTSHKTMWWVEVFVHPLEAELLSACRGGKSKGGGCDDLGDPQDRLGKTFGDWLLYSEEQTLYIYYKNLK